MWCLYSTYIPTSCLNVAVTILDLAHAGDGGWELLSGDLLLDEANTGAWSEDATAAVARREPTMPNSRTLSLLLLLLLVSAEVIDVSARAQLASNAGTGKSSTLKRPRKRQGRRRASKNDGEQKTDDKATFVADFLKKTNCDLNQLPKLFKSARKRDIKLSKSAVMQEYKTCLIEKAKEKEAEKSKDNKKDEDEQRELLLQRLLHHKY